MISHQLEDYLVRLSKPLLQVNGGFNSCHPISMVEEQKKRLQPPANSP